MGKLQDTSQNQEKLRGMFGKIRSVWRSIQQVVLEEAERILIGWKKGDEWLKGILVEWNVSKMNNRAFLSKMNMLCLSRKKEKQWVT